MIVDFGFFALLCLLSGVLAWVDIDQGIIPDWLNGTIAGLGLSKAVIAGGTLAGLEAACEGAAIGAIFWLLRRLYFGFRKIQGLGLGDVKFLAAAGIWVGVAGLPTLLLIAALTALVCACVMQLAGRQLTGQTSISFGPFLAIGLLLTSGLQQSWPCCGSLNISERTYQVAAATSPTAALRRSPVAERLHWPSVPRQAAATRG